MALLLSRGTISESVAATLTGLSVLNSRAVISSLLSLGLLHIVGEKQLRMKNRRRYVEVIFGIDPIAATRVLRDILSNTISLMKSVIDTIESEQFAYYCEKDKAIFFETEIELTEYCCPICGEPLSPIWINIEKINSLITRLREEFKKII